MAHIMRIDEMVNRQTVEPKYDANEAEGHSFVILTCHTRDKQGVMDLLLDAEEYKLVGDTVDCWYSLGDGPQENADLEEIINSNIQKLADVGITCELSYS